LIAPVYAQDQESAEVMEASASFGLNEAINAALRNAPELREAQAMLGAADGERRQAGALPNPTLGIEAENVAGSGAYTGTDGMEATVSIGQTIELGGKRSARKAMAERGQDLAKLDQVAAKADVIRKVRIAYANAIAAQEAIDLAQREHDLAKDILGGVSRRVNAGGEPLHQRSKAQIALTSSELSLSKARRERDAALNALARLTGMTTPPMLNADDFYAIEAPDDLAIKIEDTPGHQRLHQEIGLRKSALDLEQANAMPDPTISVGARNFREDDENALVLGVSFPLPVANLNRGNIHKAGQEVAAAEAVHDRSLRDAYASLEEREVALQASFEEAQAMKATILPQAEEALKNARHGYDAGAFAYLDVLDAQRTLSDSKTAYLTALRDYHINKAEIDYLTTPATLTGTQ
jgi:cobalt-zinc-cadmium efflux system outer membrane protein